MQYFDWMTWSVEAAGIVIFLAWIIVPIREFRVIIRRIVERPSGSAKKGWRGAAVVAEPARAVVGQSVVDRAGVEG